MRARTTLVLVTVIASVAAGCGSSDDNSGTSSVTTLGQVFGQRGADYPHSLRIQRKFSGFRPNAVGTEKSHIL